MKRAFITGIFFSIALGLLEPFLLITQVYSLSSDFFTAGAYFFILIAILLSGAFSFIHRKFILSSAELLLIFIMLSAACVIPSWGVMGNLFPAIAGLKYIDSQITGWGTLFLDKIGPWIINTNHHAVTYFYESKPPLVPGQYISWIRPFSFWLGFLLVFSFLSICIAVMLRKQWVENERLTFPLAIVPLEITRKDSPDERLPSIFRNKLVWLGFIITFLLISLNGISFFIPGFGIKFAHILPIFRRTDTIVLLVSFPIIAFAYFLPLNIAFSLVLFHLLAKVQTGMSNLSGYSLPGGNEIFGGSSAATSFQGGGAMVFFFLYIIFLARKHLKEIFLKAAGIRKDIDDSGEILSYKTAFWGWVISILFLSGFLRYIGMPVLVIIVFIFFTHAVFVSLAKIIAQAGIGFARPQCPPPDLAAYLLPPGLITPSGYSALGLQYVWSADIRTTVMASTLNGLKMNEKQQIKPHIVFWGIITAVVLAYITSSLTTLFIGYKYGALNSAARWFHGSGMPEAIGNFIGTKIRAPMTPDIILSRMSFAGIGGAVMLALIFMQQRFLWWPLHYIGFPIADSWVIRWAWFSIFIAWFIKILLLRYAGINFYKKSIPFFIGLLLGVIGAACIWVPINLFYGRVINAIMFGVP